MASIFLDFRPGVNTTGTQLQNAQGWSQSNLIRFKDGYLQSLGGWLRITNDELIGICRGMVPNATLIGQRYIACGTSSRFEIYYAGNLYDATPKLHQESVSGPFSTTSGSDVLKVTDTANGAAVGDWIYVGSRVSVGNQIVTGYYLVDALIDSNNFTTTTNTNFVATASGLGTLPAYTTISTNTVVSVALNNHGLNVGDTFTVFVSTTVGGLTLYGDYIVTVFVDANNFKFDTGIAATGSATVSENGDDVLIQYAYPSEQAFTRQWALDTWGEDIVGNYTDGPLFVWIPTEPFGDLNPMTVIANTPTVATVDSPGTGYVFADQITTTGGVGTAQTVLQVTTTQLVSVAVNAGGSSYTVGDTITLAGGTFTIAAVLTVLTLSGSAVATFGITTGGAYTVNSATFTQGSTSGGGTGATFNMGVFGVGTVLITVPGNYTTTPSNPVAQGSTTGSGTGATFDLTYDTAPAENIWSFVAMPQQQLVALGCTDRLTGQQDPLLIRFSDIDNYTSWTPSTTNQAGSYRIPSGSTIVGGLQMPQFAYIFTDIEVWQMQYIGFPLVYGFTKIGVGCGLIAARAAAKIGGLLFWMSRKGFYVYDGNAVQPVPCAVWDFIWDNLDYSNLNKIFAAPNSEFNEVAFYFPYLNPNNDNLPDGGEAFGAGIYGDGPFGGNPGGEIPQTTNETFGYAKYNVKDNVWDYGFLDRSAWIDTSIIGDPVGVDHDGILQMHEISNDADGYVINSSATSGWMPMDNEGAYVYLNRVIPDMILNEGGECQLYINITNYPLDAPKVMGPYTITQNTRYLPIHTRGRLISITIGSSTMDTFWRNGKHAAYASRAGSR